ncbi:hypothetical protein EMPG_09265 [Blastomyces silverae]|uniref:F-box domain-containing protein n=1 Tax=Blastomyces silverae TaxID=2060906 RepID=A0A0H1B5U1_9EURO|nr:hypothetical protein EMPG_09265 [Blastomyces silverae]
MAALDNVPTEILLEIISLLSIQDLAALSLQCHHLNRAVNIASPHEFRRFHFSTTKNVFKFLFTILEQPRIGTFVREIVAHEYSCARHGISLIQKQPLLRSAIRKAGVDGEEAEDWMEILMGNRWRIIDYGESSYDVRTTLTRLLLAVCPNVEILRVEAIGLYLEPLFRMAKTSKNQRNYLQNLQHLDLFRPDAWDEDGAYADFDVAGNLRLVAHLPSIESFTVRGVWICGDSTGNWLPPGSSNIKKLNLYYSQFNDDDLRYLILHPKALEEFTFSSGQLLNPELRNRHKNKVKLLGKKLLCHKSTLKVLDLDVDNFLKYYRDYDHCTDDEGEDVEEDDWDSDDPREVDPRFSWEEPDTRPYGQTIGSLHDFTALNRLSIGVKALLGDRFPSDDKDWNPESEKERVPIRLIRDLPPNLEYLCIRGYVSGEDPGYTSQMEEFMANKDKWPLSLKEVHGITECVNGLSTLDKSFYELS